MIGYYVHHHGRGHLHRATVLARALHAQGDQVTGLSSLPRPDSWPGPWVRLEADDDGTPRDPTARGRLHWVPSGHAGLRARMSAVARWIGEVRPAVMVVDLSVEVVLLARLHGVPTVGVVLPGRRDDPPHLLGFDVADELVAFWPEWAESMLTGVPDEVLGRIRTVGALSRFPCATGSAATAAPGSPRGAGRGSAGRSVVLMAGGGGLAFGADEVTAAQRETPGWDWTVLGAPPGRWVDDPSSLVRSADVVITHAGQNAVAEVAAARRPVVLLPQPRPHEEQVTTAGVLAAAGLPVVVRPQWPATGWEALLEQAAAGDGATWSRWCDGTAADRMVALVRSIVARQAVR